MATFRIATFVNDERQYGEMRSSFEAAGFTSPLARYTIEPGEPYAGVTRLGQAEEPFVLLVHQDVRCAWGDTAAGLEDRLAALTAVDPNWALAGNAGVEPPRVRHISDPHGTNWATDLPRRVISLDENLLILRTAMRPKCSPQLSGWHLYGTDAVLNAALASGTAYVVDFRVTHLSAGGTQGHEGSWRRFMDHWRSRQQAGDVRDPAALEQLATTLSIFTRIEEAAKSRA